MHVCMCSCMNTGPFSILSPLVLLGNPQCTVMRELRKCYNHFPHTYLSLHCLWVALHFQWASAMVWLDPHPRSWGRDCVFPLFCSSPQLSGCRRAESPCLRGRSFCKADSADDVETIADRRESKPFPRHVGDGWALGGVGSSGDVVSDQALSWIMCERRPGGIPHSFHYQRRCRWLWVQPVGEVKWGVT